MSCFVDYAVKTRAPYWTYLGVGADSEKTLSCVGSRLALYSSRYSAGTYVILNTQVRTQPQTKKLMN